MSNALAYWRTSFLQPSSPQDWWKSEETGFGRLQKPKNAENDAHDDLQRSETSVQPRITPKARRLYGVEVPDAINDVATAIEKSEYILGLSEDWDDEGSPPYARETWERAVKFVFNVALDLWRNEQVRSEAPAVHNGPEGSIDIHWKTASAELLINVPSSVEKPATYYGQNKESRTEVKGNLDTSASNEWLLMWITAK